MLDKCARLFMIRGTRDKSHKEKKHAHCVFKRACRVVKLGKGLAMFSIRLVKENCKEILRRRLQDEEIYIAHIEP